MAKELKQQSLSGEEAKSRLAERGITLREFASRNGFSYRTVTDVVRGVCKAKFGEGHKVAVALGMKRGA